MLLLRWNAASGIRHGEKCRTGISHLQFQHNGALFRKLGGIHQQVYQDLAEARIVRIQHQDGQIRVKTHFNLQLARGHHGLHDLITQLHGIMRADVEGYIVILEIREIQNVIDKFQQLKGIHLDNFGEFPARFVIERLVLIRQYRRESDNGIQRCTYLMAHVRKKHILPLYGLHRFLLHRLLPHLGMLQTEYFLPAQHQEEYQKQYGHSDACQIETHGYNAVAFVLVGQLVGLETGTEPVYLLGIVLLERSLDIRKDLAVLSVGFFLVSHLHQ